MNRLTQHAILLLSCLSLLPGCLPRAAVRGPRVPEDWPEVVFIAPVHNQTADMDGPDIVRPMMIKALAERGYYPMPTVAVDALLEREHLAEAGQFSRIPAAKVREAIGTDAILYLNITDWSTQFLAITSLVTVSVEGVMVDARTGKTIWRGKKSVSKSPQDIGNSGGSCLSFAILTVANAAAHAALQDYRPIASEAIDDLAGAIPGGRIEPVRTGALR